MTPASDASVDIARVLVEMRPKLHRYCARMVGSVIDGEDVLQDALIKAVEAFFAGFGAPMPPRKVGDNVVAILADPRYATGVAFGMKGDLGIVSLNG